MNRDRELIERRRETGGSERQRERARRARANEGYKHTGCFSPLSRKKGDRKRDRGTGNVLSSVHCREGRVQCGGIEWSEKSNGVDLRRGMLGETRETREKERERERSRRRECYRIKWLRAHKRDFELATLFDVSRAARSFRRTGTPRPFRRDGNGRERRRLSPSSELRVRIIETETFTNNHNGTIVIK